MTHDDDDDVATKGFVRSELRIQLTDLEERMHADFGQHTKTIMEHMTSLMRPQTEQITSIERTLTALADKLDAHVADETVHVSAARGRRDRASRTPRRR
jgi:hypothetical protein